MLDKKFFGQLRKQYTDTSVDRRKIAALSGQAQHLAKQAIFALQREEFTPAKKLISESQLLLLSCKKIRLANEELESQGSFRAAQEEYVEAVLFYAAMTDGRIGKVLKMVVPMEVYLGGLADMVGEISRQSVILVTKGNIKKVHVLAKIASDAVSELSQMNLVGYLRNKFDQAQQALRRLEGVLYDLSLKNK